MFECEYLFLFHLLLYLPLTIVPLDFVINARTQVLLVFAILKLVNRVCDAGSQSGVKLKKLFQFVHDTIIGLASIIPISVRLFLHASLAADTLAGKAGEKGGVYSAIAYEFVVQALIVYEEMANSSRKNVPSTKSSQRCINVSTSLRRSTKTVTRVTQPQRNSSRNRISVRWYNSAVICSGLRRVQEEEIRGHVQSTCMSAAMSENCGQMHG